MVGMGRGLPIVIVKIIFDLDGASWPTEPIIL